MYKDSWLLAPDSAFASLQRERLESLMKKAHTLGKNPLPLLVPCRAEHFAEALRADCDFALANAVETLTELQVTKHTLLRVFVVVMVEVCGGRRCS